MKIRKIISDIIKESFRERIPEIESFNIAHPEIKPTQFNLSLILDSILKWKNNNYDVNINDKKIVDRMTKKKSGELPPIIIYKYTESGGYKIIDGWHRSLAAFLRGEKYISALVKDYTRSQND